MNSSLRVKVKGMKIEESDQAEVLLVMKGYTDRKESKFRGKHIVLQRDQ